ncbi:MULTISPECIES: tRNA uridine 5-oxyacetic acid(34) methyltransferase CmoM [unclassified Gilliamella]|uniref:tRNA uridine 5-oxyacetic acid(34) methyltransferase CmoM n=1 Tax=unclassified Gilliamella TaxID=2685620 RepID=UPI00226AADE5|nr:MULTISPECIES: tRNA uridine 5-oxyacetic acid(34) methyltransferase CmoM [unclassified Gilliamella]MCX8585118.1 tRNA uridine 5-oxyacetic acid(34) methyltransferase CmoM [Gilliamella sp. B3562]MCX8596751.1 tRNA uridine 5-oxyacetic acid(34) methyltransferase CmoM [Gilliamella sp. B3493]MCX8598479.1 tRNA uridine 5-oxyacetic acid(34) methyltransferase CmoM [Gilliamella sp. B3486]MCX8669844.1 tRNA uridine 5-oxyacetic acid(34) methyltransferase CmoM [Gilliamella sp. B2785]MCX8678567.1 tRNA uridine 
MTVNDRNFDDISHKFAKNIYGTTKGKIREAIVWQELENILAKYPKPINILDAGGGQGQIACRLAKLGHNITVCDISKQMLDLASHQAQQENLTLNFIHCSIQNLDKFIDQPFDLVICHAVLEWVADPVQIIQSLKRHLKKEGYLSLMFYNYHGLLFKTVTLGNFGYTQSGLAKRKKKTLSPDYPRDPNQVYQWLIEQSFEITNKTGIRVFHDYLTNKSKAETHFDQLLEIEKQYCQSEPYINLARYILVTAKLLN